MCLNWKLGAGLGLGAAVVVAVVSPAALLAVVPVLLVAACSLSMLLMARGMTGTGRRDGDELVTTTTDPR